MRRLQVFLSLMGMLAASTAFSLPDPTKSVLGINLPPEKRPFLTVVGTNGGVPDILGNYEIEVRDGNNNVIPGSVVEIDFSNCCEVKVACTQAVGETYVAPKTVRATTNALGRVTFRALGAGGGSPPTLLGQSCARVIADGVVLGNLKVSAFDYNGDGNFTALDLSSWNADFVGGGLYQRADLDANGVVTSADGTFLQQALFAGGT